LFEQASEEAFRVVPGTKAFSVRVEQAFRKAPHTLFRLSAGFGRSAAPAIDVYLTPLESFEKSEVIFEQGRGELTLLLESSNLKNARDAVLNLYELGRKIRAAG